MKSEEKLDSNWKRRFRRNVLNWFERNQRALPWRETNDPYAIWVSEIMLQQTTVTAVLGYYKRFLKVFPTVEDLAEADEADVLKVWEGMGYYRRARHLHQAARLIVDEWGGTFPETPAEILQLPGIGRYTAGAILSFAFGKRAPILETNTLRLYSRLLGLTDDPRTADAQKTLWSFAEQILPRKSPGTFNQALMETGSLICTPLEPLCDECPLTSCCEAFRLGKTDEIPPPKKQPKLTHLTEVGVAACRGDRFLLRQRPPSERWSGLWDFPRFEVAGQPSLERKFQQLKQTGVQRSVKDSKNSESESATSVKTISPQLQQTIEQEFQELTGLQIGLQDSVKVINYSVTRYRVQLLCVPATVIKGRVKQNSDEHFQFVRPEEFDTYPFSVSGRKFAAWLNSQSE